ncbi:MAG: hypothetical protein M1832_002546 [Thelocarpon impressellum]|nr:MAG: hypothetical protein M1832_002546 [Thelocarpon impressellum]
MPPPIADEAPALAATVDGSSNLTPSRIDRRGDIQFPDDEPEPQYTACSAAELRVIKEAWKNAHNLAHFAKFDAALPGTDGQVARYFGAKENGYVAAAVFGKITEVQRDDARVAVRCDRANANRHCQTPGAMAMTIRPEYVGAPWNIDICGSFYNKAAVDPCMTPEAAGESRDYDQGGMILHELTHVKEISGEVIEDGKPECYQYACVHEAASRPGRDSLAIASAYEMFAYSVRAERWPRDQCDVVPGGL